MLNNARYHYSKALREYLEGNSRINVVFLPTYSPELNLIARIWRFFKKKALYNQYHADVKTFRQACVDFFKNTGKLSEYNFWAGSKKDKESTPVILSTDNGKTWTQ
ncbi:transposase [Marinagarivorans algicola]|uniref:transposase n=1 Tax=Marinagarivorans algicola TaxID=1513270 RepID=UPI0037362CC4